MDIGSRTELAFSIGEKQPPDMQIIDIWLDSILVTYYDNTVYLPAFIFSLEQELEDLEKGLINSDYVFFEHGPTTDDVVARAKIDGDVLYLTCELDNSQTINVSLSLCDVISTYKECIKHLSGIAT